MRYETLETDAGPVAFATDGGHVTELLLGKRRKPHGRATPLDREVARQLRRYFRGRLDEFDLPLRIVAPRFRAAVLAEVEGIPMGESRTYGEIAGAVGNPRAARAVGQAVGANPLPIVIPCHRVLAANGLLGGFGGGLRWKRYLLDLEGISWRT